MPLTKSIFDYKYYLYSLKKSAPYVATMSIIMFVVNFVVYAIGFSVSGFDGNVNVLELSYPNFFFIYFYPVLLSIGLFNFLYNKKTADFFGAIPVKRTTLFMTNIILGATVFFFMILINTLFLAVIFKVFLSTSVVIAPPVFLYYFFFWFIGFMVMFAGASLAATLSGSITAQVFLTAVIIFIPGLIVNISQFPIFKALNSGALMTVKEGFNFSLVSIESVVRPISIPYSFISDLFISSITYKVSDFEGAFNGFTSIGAILYNIVIILVFVALGVLLMKKRRFEIAENPYANKYVMGATKALAFIPFIVLLFYFAITDLNITTITLLLTILTTGYIIVDLILKKNFRHFGKSMLLYAGGLGISFVFSITMNITETNLNKEHIVITESAQIKELTVYMKPFDINDINNKAVKDVYIPVKIQDKEVIDKFLKTLNQNSNYNTTAAIPSTAEYNNNYTEYATYYMTLLLSNSKTITGQFNMSDDFNSTLYAYIDNNEQIKSSFDIYNKIKINNLTNVLFINNFESDNINKLSKTLFKTNNEIMSYINNVNKERQLLSADERLNKTDYNFIKNYYNYNNSNDLIIPSDSKNTLYLQTVYYYKGHYYEDVLPLSVEDEITKTFIKDINKNSQSAVKNLKDDSFTVEILGKPVTGDKVQLALIDMLDGICKTSSNELRDAALNADKENIFDNFPAQINFYRKTFGANKTSYNNVNTNRNIIATMFINWDDIIPLMDIYKQKSLDALETLKNEDIRSIDVYTWTDGELLTGQINYGKPYTDINVIDDIYKSCVDNIAIIKKYYEGEFSAKDLTGDMYIVKVYDLKVNLYVYILDDSAEIIKYEYPGSDGNYNGRKIANLVVNGIKISNSKDIRYFMQALSATNFVDKATPADNGYTFEIYYDDGGTAGNYDKMQLSSNQLSYKMLKKLEELKLLQTEQGGE